jgi:hypothetical protein
MADTRYLAPRRPGVTIYLHVADIVDVMSQRQMLQSMTEKELTQIAESINAELSTRGEQNNEPQQPT